MIHLIMTDYIIYFSYDLALVHPLLHTEEHMLRAGYTDQPSYRLDDPT